MFCVCFEDIKLVYMKNDLEKKEESIGLRKSIINK